MESSAGSSRISLSLKNVWNFVGGNTSSRFGGFSVFQSKYIGSLMYINLLLGNQNRFSNMTSQIQNISSDLKMTRDEVFGRFDNLNASLIHVFPDIFNHSIEGKSLLSIFDV